MFTYIFTELPTRTTVAGKKQKENKTITPKKPANAEEKQDKTTTKKPENDGKQPKE